MLLSINKDLHVVAESWSRGNQAWGHKAVAYYRGVAVAENKVRYYNRTWERYQFESVLQGLTNKLDTIKNIPLSDRIQLANKIASI